MRLLVILFALAMPFVAWLTNSGTFGPDNGEMSDRYPTLLVAAGYAFAIWGLIFLWDAAYAVWQASGDRKRDDTLGRIAPWTAAGFALTTAWMPLFSMAQFWWCLLVIFAGLGCVLRAALILSRDPTPHRHQVALAWMPLSLHAGWLSMAAFLNLAQVIVAYRLLPVRDMLGWSLVLLVAAAAGLMFFNHRMRGNPAYALAAIWALVAVFVKQRAYGLDGGQVMAWIALAIAAVLAGQTLLLRLRADGECTPSSRLAN